MKNKTTQNNSRRRFLGTGAALASGLIVAPAIGVPAIIYDLEKPKSKINGVEIGVITYSFRSMPDQSAEATLQYVLDAGISAIELMGDPAEYFAGKPRNKVDRRAFGQARKAKRDGDTLTKEQQEILAATEAYNKEVAAWRASVSMDKFKALRKMYKQAGVKIYGFKPSAFGKNNTDAEINFGMKAAKALGASHVTLEHPSDDAHTLKLGTMAKKHKVYVGYHGHTQQTPTFWDTALQQSKYNAMNIDIGHYVAAGHEKPLEILQQKHRRIKSMHVKDRTTPENGKKNLVWGTGDTPIIQVLQLMRDQGYKFPATIELEYKIPEGSDAVKEVAACLAYCRKVLS